MIQKEVVITSDGSSSIFLPEWNESYHSKHGAIQEANHVFIKSGFEFASQNPLHILEIGFGTGLNALLTLHQSIIQNREVFYTGVEAYPVTDEILNALNYSEILDKDNSDNYFQILHQIPWEVFHEIEPNFHLCKRQQYFDEIDDEESFDLIYFDAFGYRVQPELWGEEIFKKMYKALKKKGVLVTYACRTPIKKAMEASGFKTEKLPGPPGKREMLRAVKLG
jgi:tRNA U34 5-methylaminomethyl-2-thiouridine-forming methyltransferase MnmC